jgi:type I thyroxine 5'-deiodinase
VGDINGMHDRYKDKVEFLLVYIREAHPTDGRQVPANQRENVLYAEPKSDEERHEVAGVCIRKLDIHMPALIDNLKNTTEAAYAGWPDRLYLVDRGGRIAYKGQPGPAGFRPAELEAAIRTVLNP